MIVSFLGDLMLLVRLSYSPRVSPKTPPPPPSQTLRPLGEPRASRRRACAMLSVRCVGARWTKVGDEAKLEFDFEVSYCGRVAVVLGVFAEGIADCLGAVFKRELRELRRQNAELKRQCGGPHR